MAKFWTDASDSIAPPGEPARLVVTLTPLTTDLYAVTAEIEREPPMTGQFVVNPDWQFQGERRSTVQSFPTDPGQDVGAQLFSALFSGSLSRVWAQARDRARTKNGLHIVIRSSSQQVHSLPWELLSDTTLTSSEHIAISEGWSVIRDIRKPDAAHEPGRNAPTPRDHLEVVALTTPSSGASQQSDIDILIEAFGRDAVTAKTDADKDTVLAELSSESANIVHILGTGRQERSFVQDLVLSDTGAQQVVTVSGPQLTAPAANAERLDLVVLAACYTDQLAAQLAGVVPAVIGIRGLISDTGRQVFLSGLYRALAVGATVTQAVAAGRAQQVLSRSLGDEWAQPVLYLSVDAPLVAAPPAEQPYPGPVTLPLSASDDDQMTQLIVNIKQANLHALRAQWGPVDDANVPAIIARQMESLAHELEGLTGDALVSADPETVLAPSVANRVPPGHSRATVSRLAAAVVRLTECKAVVDAMARDIEALKPTRLTAVVGEEKHVELLRQQLSDAHAQITGLTAAQPAHARSFLDQLEAAVSGPLWEIGRSTAQELADRRVQIEEQAHLIKEEYSSMRLNIDRLAHAARRAEEVRLEGAEQQKNLAGDVEGLFRASDPERRMGHYDKAAVAVRHAKALLLEADLATRTEAGAIVVDAAKLDVYTKAFEEQIKEQGVRDDKMARRAELFVISGGETDMSVPYKVLLRRPGYGDIQETNLYDDVEALVMDQALFRDTIDRISETALVGIRSAAPTAANRSDTAPGESEVQGSSGTALGATTELRRASPAHSELLDQLDPRTRLERIGRRMYSLLIPDAMQRLIDETDEYPLTITSNNPELPWELLHDGRDFLCLKRMFARMPAGQTFPRRTRDTTPLPEARQPKVLLIHSEAGEALPKALAEIDAIKERLSAMEPKPLITLLTGRDVTSSRLTDELSLGNYDVIHYAGHAGFDALRPHRSYLLLTSGELFRAERVQRLLEGHPVVFLNACESTRASPQSTGLPTGSTVAQAEGLGSAFVYGGAQACVGSLWPVFDDTAAELAITFYEQLIAKRQRVGEALREARLHSYQDKSDAITWAAYALYGDPAYRLGSPSITTWSATA